MNQPMRSSDPERGQVRRLCVSLVPIFNHLPHEELATVAGKARMRTYARGEFIHRAGEQSDQLLIVHRGRVKIYRLSDEGREQLLRILEPGHFMGELALFAQRRHDSYAEALEDSEVCAIDRKDLHELLQEHPAVGIHVLDELAQRLGKSERQTASIGTVSIDARIAGYLLSLAEEADTCTIRLPMTRRDLASFLGVAPETVSRRLTMFESRGWISQSGQRSIRILDMDALLLV